MKFDTIIDGDPSRRVVVEWLREGVFRIGKKDLVVDVQSLAPGVYSLIVDGRSYEVAVREQKKGMVVEMGPHIIPVQILDFWDFRDPRSPKGIVSAEILEGEAVVASPMPGRIVSVKVVVGQAVKSGEGIVVVEAMKMENELHAPKKGKIKSIEVKVGDTVEAGQDLVVVE